MAYPVTGSIQIDHDLVWVLSLGERSTFLDKMQLLYTLPNKTRLINSLDALMHLKSKYFLSSRPDIYPSPETHASPSASALEAIIKDKGGQWIIKPPAGSLGRDVFRVNHDDNNLPAILDHLCGPEDTNYTLIQRYVPEIESGEKRVLLAGGTVIGQYRRLAQGNDHRTNVSQGANTEACDLTPDEKTYCEKLAQDMMKRGAWFAGVDLAYPWLIEVNVVNPGGLATIEALTGKDLSPAVARAVTSAIFGK